jgi:dTDP-4-dehydrorhamnose 3,5-epimerase
MRFSPTELAGAWLIDIEPHGDERGFFARTFCAQEFADHGLPSVFPQSNLSRNDRARTLRGMHLNTAEFPEAKLVRCARGAIHDVLLDVRPGSPSEGCWIGVDLDAADGRAVFVPAGVAHGFVTLVDGTDVEYQMSASYEPDAARGIRWDDPRFGIRWPVQPVVMSERDAAYPDFDPSLIEG